MMVTSLVIMAAGIGSRFGCGIKQLTPVGPSDEIIMDYSIHDAIRAGFNDIVFIIRRDIERDFREAIGDRIERTAAYCGVTVHYAYQDPSDLPSGVLVPAGRTKPWGTGQAILACRELIDHPFVVINADDYYGCEAFFRLHDFLVNDTDDRHYAMAGFVLKNTLSESGTVTRGICRVDDRGQLVSLVETKEIAAQDGGVFAGDCPLCPDDVCSMNMWALKPSIFGFLEQGFIRFFADPQSDLMKGEFLLPVHIGKLLDDREVSVSVLPTADRWFGVTYQSDRKLVVNSIKQLVEDGVYRRDLYADLPRIEF